MQSNNEYGKALFLLCEEQGCAKDVWMELRSIKKILTDNPKYVTLIDTPALSKEKKMELIDQAFAPVNEYVKNLIKILCERHAFYTFAEIEKTYDAYYLEAKNIIMVEAITAIPLTEKQILDLKMKIGEETGKHSVIENTVDESILGGVILRYEGKQLDGSLKARLDRLASGLKNTVI